MSDTIYTIAGFLENTDDKIRSFTEASEKNAWDSVLKNKTENIIPDIKIDMSYLDSMVNIAVKLGINAKEIVDFLSEQKTIDYLMKNPTTVNLTYDYDIISVRTTGLKNYVRDLRDLFNDISSGKKDGDDVRSWINDPRTVVKYKKSINDSCADAYRTSKDILKPQPKKDYLLDDTTIHSIKAFLSKFNKLYASTYIGKKDEINASEVSFAHGTAIIKEQIRKNQADLDSYISAAMKSNIPTGIVTQIAYTAKVTFAELCKYIVASYLQFMSERIHDVRTLYSKMNELTEIIYPDTGIEAEMESVGIDPLNYTLDDSDIILDAIDKAKNDIRTNNQYDHNYEDYDKRAYDLPIELLTRLSEVLKEGTEFYREKHDMVTVDLIVRRFDLKNDKVWGVLSDIFYGNKYLSIIDNNICLVMNDLNHMGNMIPTFKNLIKLCIASLNEWIMLAKAVGKEDNDMLDVLKYIDDSLSELYSSSAKKFVERLNKLYAIAFPAKDHEKLVFTDENNYFIDAFNANYDAIEESFNDKLYEMNRVNQQLYIESVISPRYTFEQPYFEADDNGNSNNNQNNQQNNQSNGTNNNDQNNNQNNGNKQSTTPKVTDNSAESSNNNNQNSGNNNGNNDQNSDNKGSQKISDRVKNFLNNVVDKITNFFNKDNAKDKNMKFVEDHKDYLNKRSYANVNLQMLPYIQVDYVSIMKGIIAKAENINEAQLRTLTEDKLYEYLYSDTQYARVKGNTPDERFEIAIKVGTNKNEPVTYSNNTIKKMIPAMTTYISNYYHNIENDLKGITSNLNGLDKLSTYKGNGNNDNTAKNVSLIPRIINAGIGSCINVARQRANDYIVVLNSLVPKAEKDKANGNNNQNNNQENTNNNNNNQNQNNQQNNNQNAGNENNQ